MICNFNMTGRREAAPPTTHTDTLLHLLALFVVDLFNAGYQIHQNNVHVGRTAIDSPAAFTIQLQTERATYPTVNAEKPEQMFRVFRDTLIPANWIIETSLVSCSGIV